MLFFSPNNSRKRCLGEERWWWWWAAADGWNLHQSGGVSSPTLIKLTEDGRREREPHESRRRLMVWQRRHFRASDREGGAGGGACISSSLCHLATRGTLTLTECCGVLINFKSALTLRRAATNIWALRVFFVFLSFFLFCVFCDKWVEATHSEATSCLSR